MEKTVETKKDLLIDPSKLKRASLVFRAVNHKLRQQILQLIHQKGRMVVTDIYVKLRLEQSVASQQLAILRKEGLVLTERDGKFIFYSVNYDRLKHLHKISEDLIRK
ncbi:MAG TPA: metalloregulator ArsR/SmtB family transcription factor [Chitinophagaceae bacterium]